MKNRALDFRLARTVGAIRLLTELPDEGWVSIRSSPKGVGIHSPVQVATRRKFCPHTCAGNQKERRSTSPTALRILAQPRRAKSVIRLSSPISKNISVPA